MTNASRRLVVVLVGEPGACVLNSRTTPAAVGFRGPRHALVARALQGRVRRRALGRARRAAARGRGRLHRRGVQLQARAHAPSAAPPPRRPRPPLPFCRRRAPPPRRRPPRAASQPVVRSRFRRLPPCPKSRSPVAHVRHDTGVGRSQRARARCLAVLLRAWPRPCAGRRSTRWSCLPTGRTSAGRTTSRSAPPAARPPRPPCCLGRTARGRPPREALTVSLPRCARARMRAGTWGACPSTRGTTRATSRAGRSCHTCPTTPGPRTACSSTVRRQPDTPPRRPGRQLLLRASDHMLRRPCLGADPPPKSMPSVA